MTVRPQHRFDIAHFFKWLPVYLFCTLVLYVLSAGPMYPAIYDSYVVEQNRLTYFYLPLVVACESSETFSAFMNWYVDLWV